MPSRFSSVLSKAAFLPVVPTERAAWGIAAFAPIALLVAAVAPGFWVIAPITAAGLIILVLLDAGLAGSVHKWEIEAPADTEIGQSTDLILSARHTSSRAREVEGALETDPRLATGGSVRLNLAYDSDKRHHEGCTTVHPTRRGSSDIVRAWLRWTGPLG